MHDDSKLPEAGSLVPYFSGTAKTTVRSVTDYTKQGYKFFNLSVDHPSVKTIGVTLISSEKFSGEGEVPMPKVGDTVVVEFSAGAPISWRHLAS